MPHIHRFAHHAIRSTLCLVAVFTARAPADEIDNPYRHAKVGDWATYEFSLDAGAFKTKSEDRIDVVSNDGKTVKLKKTSKHDGKTEESTETIKLDEPYSVKVLLGYAEDFKLPIESKATGKERRMIGLTPVMTAWTVYAIGPQEKHKAERQVWVSKEIPLNGVVASVMTSEYSRSQSSTVMTGFGFGDGRSASVGSKGKTPADAEKPKRDRTSLGASLVLIPKGTCIQGAVPLNEFLANAAKFNGDRERLLEALCVTPPQMPVLIANDYWMAAHETTIGQFREFVRNTAYRTDAEKDGSGGTGMLASGEFGYSPEFTWQYTGYKVSDDHPVSNVSWNDATAFCEWLSKKEGKGYRLPTEAEWEHACRASSTTTYSCGTDPKDLRGHSNIADKSLKQRIRGVPWAMTFDDGFEFAAPVGRFKPNAWELHDMHGNVLEWCRNSFSFTDPVKEFDLPQDLTKRYVVRGGNWFNSPSLAGSAARSGNEPSFRNALTGFRIVREAD